MASTSPDSISYPTNTSSKKPIEEHIQDTANSIQTAITDVRGDVDTLLLSKASISHSHAGSDITSGLLGIEQGGTGATTGSGLVPVVASSISVGSGTGSVNASGLITFAGATSISVNGIFTSTYNNYELHLYGLYGSVDNQSPFFRYRASGTDNGSSQYYQSGSSYQNSNGAVGSWGTGASAQFDFGRWRTNSATSTSERHTIFNPAVAGKQTQLVGSGFWENSSSPYGFTITGVVNNTTAYDGFSIVAQSGNMTGFIKVYGFR